MPLTKDHRMRLLRHLDEVYHELWNKHYNLSPRNGEVPTGGGEWMDVFFKSEAVRGTITRLRNDGSVREAIADGKTVSEIAIQLWNTKREWQVHRWEKCCHQYLEHLVKSALRSTRSG